jgi:hypothetical protein
MAKRKKTRSKTRRRSRRSVGAIGKGFAMDALGLVAGAAIARVVTDSPKILPKIDSKVKSAGVIALGVFFPKILKGSLGKSIGDGMIAAGGLGLVQSYGVLGAINDSMQIPVTVMAGDGEDGISVIAGQSSYAEDRLSVLAGDDDTF